MTNSAPQPADQRPLCATTPSRSPFPAASSTTAKRRSKPLRAWEELAIAPEQVRLIETTDRYQTGTGFDITPVLATVPHDLTIRPDPREVESWFECARQADEARSSDAQFRVFWQGAQRDYLEMDHDGYRIWGVTAAICWNLSRAAWPGSIERLPAAPHACRRAVHD